MINKVKINPIDRINRIAMTGDIEDPKPLSPVDNIMQHYPKAQETPQEEGGFWNGLKNFAGSKGGRMLIGGLGTGLAVGLTGGGLQNALGYGVIGAGKTAENIYNQEQDQKAWEEKEADRLARQQENEANRQHDWDIAKAKIKADREARKDEMDRVLKTLELKNEYGAFDKKGDSLSGATEFVDYMAKNYGWTPEQSLEYYGKMTPKEKLDFYEQKGAIDTANKITVANNEFGNKSALQDDAQAYGFEMEDKKHGNKLEAMGADYGYKSKLQSQKAKADEEKAKRDFERALAKSDYDNELKKDFEEYKTTLPLPEILEYEQRAKALQKEGLNYTVGDLILEDYLNDVASRNRTNALTGYTNAQTDFVTGAKTDLTKAQINNVNARTGLTEAQAQNVKNPNIPSFSELQTGVNNGTITAETGNRLYGQDVFQATTGTPEEQKERQQQLIALQGVGEQLNNFEAMFDKLPQSKFSAYTGGAWRDLTGTLTQDESDFNAQRTLLFNKIARDLGGEKGVLSDQDIKRVSDALPTIYDSPEQRAGKMAAVRNLLNIRMGQVNQGVNLDGGYGLDIGTIDGEYRYIGGDPQFEKSWELVQ